LGGRMGYVFIYDFSFYIKNWLEIPAIWHGGMSYHGGALGALIATFIFSKQYKVSFLNLMDLICLGSPIGIFFGRLANFINGELFGRVTTSAFGIVFPGGGPLPRHPSQLYEALFEGVFLGIILFLIYKNTNYQKGRLLSFYLIGYGIIRFFLEFFREPDNQIGFFFNSVTMGQILCLFMVGLGIILIYLFSKNTKKIRHRKI